MKRLRSFCLGLALLAATGRAQEATDFPASPWAEAFQTADAIHATFREERHLAIRRTPLELSGEMRFQTGLGLSLHYQSPEERTVIVDDEGVLLRDARGRSRRAPLKSEAAASAAVLLKVLRFDLSALAENFFIVATPRTPPPEAAPWSIRFEPTEKAAAKGIAALLVSGHGREINRIVLGPGTTEEIVITILSVDRQPAFPAEVTRAFFR